MSILEVRIFCVRTYTSVFKLSSYGTGGLKHGIRHGRNCAVQCTLSLRGILEIECGLLVARCVLYNEILVVLTHAPECKGSGLATSFCFQFQLW